MDATIPDMRLILNFSFGAMGQVTRVLLPEHGGLCQTGQHGETGWGEWLSRWTINRQGGCGHLGLPLAITLAHHALRVSIYDNNEQSVGTVRSGRMPFLERGADRVLERVLEKNVVTVRTLLRIPIS